MLTKHTIHTFLNSASVNMSKKDMKDLTRFLEQMPGLHRFVSESKKEIHDKECRIFGRKVAAAEHLAERLDNARCATNRAIEVHKRAQHNLREKLSISENAECSRRRRAEDLYDQMCNAKSKACKLQEQLCQMETEE